MNAQDQHDPAGDEFQHRPENARQPRSPASRTAPPSNTTEAVWVSGRLEDADAVYTRYPLPDDEDENEEGLNRGQRRFGRAITGAVEE